MDIEQLITSIDRLKSKDDDLNQKMIAKKSTLDKVNSEIDKEKQRLEDEVRKLAHSVEMKLKESEKIDSELSNRSSLLERMQKARALKAEQQTTQKEEVADNIARASLQQNGQQNGKITVNTTNLKENSLEDFLKLQFEQEFQVKYPKVTDRYLDERDFGQIRSILKQRMQHSKEPHKVVDDYLENYRQSVSSEQAKMLKDLKAEFGNL